MGLEGSTVWGGNSADVVSRRIHAPGVLLRAGGAPTSQRRVASVIKNAPEGCQHGTHLNGRPTHEAPAREYTHKHTHTQTNSPDTLRLFNAPHGASPSRW